MSEKPNVTVESAAAAVEAAVLACALADRKKAEAEDAYDAAVSEQRAAERALEEAESALRGASIRRHYSEGRL